ncbi:uncharacterized protein LOC111123483 isoform X4 [Crassostrea virginica]
MATCTRNVRVDEDDNQPYRKCSTATIRSEGTGTQYYSKHGGIQHMYDSSDTSSLDSFKSNSSCMRIRRVSSSIDGSSRFPRLLECAHFHYDVVDLPNFQASLCDEEQENFHHVAGEEEGGNFLIKITCGKKGWMVKRTHKNFCMLDRQLHKCMFDRKFSRLPELQKSEEGKSPKEMELFLQSYLTRFSDIAGNMINCGSILNWFEIDNRGNRLLVMDDSGINTPAIAAAHAVKRYTSQAIDEISLEVGDIVSVIDMPSIDDTIWWRGKRGFEVGFFPAECVEVIGDKIPASVQSMVPINSNSKKPLVRKHGKFLSFLRMFFNTRPPRNQLKQSGIVKERVFGCDLGEHLLNSGHDVPLVLKCCSAFIEEMGIVDGIYRLSGITSNIQKLRLAFDEDRVPDLTEEIYLQDIHCISSLLKMYFRELPNPLLTYQLYDKFADAVRDEDNKLWKIHDVVQQLPPPHYRTTEFLMRHLAKVAAFGKETGMHSKNLAIVWAPNLLRSKELECGGGAAALQGVGIQAVVTECLIVYADLIFSDKLPSYSSPELKPSRKKPRPKSLAISTPTKLITLEEARERALSASLRPPHQKYIDVGSGPKGLPEKYHTVLDLPGYRKKTPLKEVGNLKAKKSPSGWRSIFSKGNRQSSMKHKNYKTGLSQSLGTGMERKAITEEDVQTWKRRRLRGAKSAESLLVLPQSTSIDSTKRMSRLVDENMLMKMFQEEESRRPLGHKRSLSSESPRSLMHTEEPVTYPSYILAGSREMAIDVYDMKDGVENENPEKRKQKQTFVRSEPKRRVVSHRRTPSAPLSPKLDESRDKSRSPKMSKQKGISQSVIEIEHRGTEGLRENLMSSSIDAEKFVLHMDDKDLLKPIDQKGRSPTSDSRKLRKSPQRDSKEMSSSPKEQKKTMEKSGNSKKKEEVIDLPESPGARRKNWLSSSSSTPSTTPDEPPLHQYFSRHHDYAEITNSESELTDNAPSSSTLKAEENANRLSDNYDNVDNAMFYLPSDETDLLQSIDQATNLQSISQANDNSAATYSFSGSETKFSSVEFTQTRTEDCSRMSKCLSVPSDIQKSLENLTSGSQTDLLSSITLSEVSTSIDSFSLSEETNSGVDRKRRSASLDSLTESPLARTLIEINAQIDQAFKNQVQRAKKLKEEKSLSIDSGDFKEEIVTSMYESENQEANTFVDRPAAEVQVVETPRLIRAPLRSAKEQNLSLNLGSSAESTNFSPSSQQSKSRTPEEHLVAFSSVQQIHSASSSSESRIISPQESPKQNLKGSASSLVAMSPMSSPVLARTAMSPLTSPVQRRPRRSQPGTPTQPWSPDSPASSPGAAQGGIVSPLMSPASSDQSFDYDSQQRKMLSRRGKVTFDLSDDDLHFLAQQGKKRDTLTRTDSNSSTSTVSSLSSPEARVKQTTKPENSQSAIPKQSAKRDFPHLLLSSSNTDTKSTSSPRSPRNQPRWEDLAGLNQDFRAMAGLDKSNKSQSKAKEMKSTAPLKKSSNNHEHLDPSFDKKLQDLSNFNELWKNQLAPTGDVCRLTDDKDSGHCENKHQLKRSITLPASMELPQGFDQRERTPECGTDERTVIEHKPMIKKSLTDCDLPQIKHCSIVTQGSTDTSSSSEMHLCESGASLVVHEETSMEQSQMNICRNDSYNQAVGHLLGRNDIQSEKQNGKSTQKNTKINKIHKIDGKEVMLNMPVLPPLELSGFPQFENSDEVPITGASRLSCDKSEEKTIERNDLLGTEASFPVNLSDSYYDNSDMNSYGGDNSVNMNSFGGQSSMMEDIDINESCFGIPTHQNLSNEMRERMQDRFKVKKDHSPIFSDDMQADLVVQEFPNPMGMDESYDHPHGMEVEATGYTSITRPAEDIQLLSQGPLITAEPFVVEQIEPSSQMVKPIDNSEEEAQNAINADKELNMTLQSSLNQNACFVPSCESEVAMETDVCSRKDGPLPQLPPPEQEFLEVRRPRVMKTIKKNPSSEGSSEKGENEVIVEHRASFKKKAPVPLPTAKLRKERKQPMEVVDFSDLNDDVFVDDIKSNITSSKLVSHVQHKSVAERCVGNFPALEEPPNRSSLDESVLQMASSRHGDFTAEDGFSSHSEDVRFTKAHKSTKLQSLKELFEKSCKESAEKFRMSNPSSQENLVCLPTQQSPETNRVVNARASFGKQKSYSQIEQSSFEQLGACSAVSDNFNVPGNRRSISTDVGYEFQMSKTIGCRSEKIEKPIGMGKPPKHRSVSRTRTGSESSMCESDQRSRSSRSVDGSPKFAREGSLSSKSSPKSQRDSSPFSQISSDDSPRGIRRCSEESSPRSVRHQSSEESSPKVLRVKSDGSPRGTRHVSFQSHNQSVTTSQGQPTGSGMVVMSSEKNERMTKSCSVLNTQGASRSGGSQDTMSRSLTLEHSHSLEEAATHLKRRGSIKELMHFFESKHEGIEEEPKRSGRQRVHSVSPTLGLSQSHSRSSESLTLVNVRHSLELPSSSALSTLEGISRPQPVRMGPKPFYSVKNN